MDHFQEMYLKGKSPHVRTDAEKLAEILRETTKIRGTKQRE
jgi:hypothetical protein